MLGTWNVWFGWWLPTAMLFWSGHLGLNQPLSQWSMVVPSPIDDWGFLLLVGIKVATTTQCFDRCFLLRRTALGVPLSLLSVLGTTVTAPARALKPPPQACGVIGEVESYIIIYIYIPRTQMTLILIGKCLVLEGWPSKIGVSCITRTWTDRLDLQSLCHKACKMIFLVVVDAICYSVVFGRCFTPANSTSTRP